MTQRRKAENSSFFTILLYSYLQICSIFFVEMNLLHILTEESLIIFLLQTYQRVTVHVNNEHCRNCCSSRGMTVFAVEVPARTKMVRKKKQPL